MRSVGRTDNSMGMGAARPWRRRVAQWCFGLLLVQAGVSQAAITQPCRVEGLANEMQCGTVKRALDPAKPEGVQIEVRFLVVPAMARNKLKDAVLVLAGGPGQSAIGIAPAVLPRLTRLNNRRDLVFIDQRGTGKSAPLQCADESRLPVQQAMDPALQLQRLRQCADDLSRLPHGDLRFYTTSIAVQDFEAVRQQLGVSQWNLIGASYGTRAALEYQRQFPAQVRRAVLDGLAPPDMVLPVSFSADGQTALDKLLDACAKDTLGDQACSTRYPQLRQEWDALLGSLPRLISVRHPVTGAPESFSLTRNTLLRAVRSPLYVPAMAAGLPAAVHAAVMGDFSGLVGIANAIGGRKSLQLAMGMHFSVVCAEDAPRIATSALAPGKDFGRSDAELYSAVCSFWPRGVVPEAFYSVPAAQSPVLLLSGGADPATPARHGESVAKALGALAQHVVVPEAGHGVMGVGCMGDVVYRFIVAASDAQAVPQDAACATGIPRPPMFVPIAPTVAAGEKP